MKRFLLPFVFCLALFAQKIDLKNQTQNADFSAFPSVVPWKVGTSLPGTCSMGQVFFKTDAPAGENIYICTATNTWTQIVGISGLTASRALVSDGSGNVAVSSVTSTELGYLGGVTSAVQTQLDSKISSLVEDTTPQLGGNLDVNGFNVAGITPTELGYLSGISSGVQAQLDDKLTASNTATLTNKTLDADGTGNSISNIGSSEIKQEIIDGLTADATPTGSTDYVMVSKAATGLRKVLLDNLPGSSGSLAIENEGSSVGTEATLNFVSGAGSTTVCVDGGAKINCTTSADTGTMLTRAQNQAGTDLECKPSSGTNTLTCSMTPALTSIAEGTTIKLIPFANNTGAVTLDIDSLGAVAVETGDSTALSADDLVAGVPVWLRSNGTEFRFVGLAPSEAGGGSSVPTPGFGAYASRPTCDSTRTLQPYYSDELAYAFDLCDGSTWNRIVGSKKMTTSQASDWTTVSADATVTDVAGTVHIALVQSAGDASGMVRAVAGTNYTSTFWFTFQNTGNSISHGCGIAISSGSTTSAALRIVGPGQTSTQQNGYLQMLYTNWNTYSSAGGAFQSSWNVPVLGLRVVRDGTNRTYYAWDGASWTIIIQEAFDAGFTETHVGLACRPGTGDRAGITLYGYNQSTP